MLFAVGLLAVEATPDPWTQFTSLGVAGLIAAVLFWLLLRAEKRADAADKRAEALAEGLRELKPAVEASTRAHESGARSQEKMIDVMEDMPSKDDWRRLYSFLDSQRKT